MSCVLAADIGGTNIRLAIVNPDGHISSERRLRAELSRTADATRERAEARVIETITRACSPILEANDIQAVGIGFPGFFRGDSGVLDASPNLPLLHDFHLGERLTASLSLPVTVQNDALCAAIGEHRFGAGRGQPDLLHLTLGTGIGGGLILNDTPYCGAHGMAMEFGHLRVVHDDDARLCGCGNRGCIETYASASAVANRYAEISHIRRDTADIARMAAGGDALARRLLTEAGQYLGQALAEAIKLLDIGQVTISGGLTGAWDILYPPLAKSLDEGLIPPLRGQVRIARSSLMDQAGLLGAALLAMESIAGE